MAGEEVVVLGSWGSPFSRRVELALRLKGIAYEYVEQDLANKSPQLLKYNPVHKKVPVLLHCGKPIAESLVILEYIDETWKGNPILPQDPYEKAMARFWAKFMEEKCFPALWMSCWTEGEVQKNFMEETKKNLNILEKELEGKKFFGGETMGLVDITGNLIAYWAGILQEVAGISLVDEDRHPILCKWIEEFLKCDVVKDTLPDRETLLSFFVSRKDAIMVTKAPVY